MNLSARIVGGLTLGILFGLLAISQQVGGDAVVVGDPTLVVKAIGEQAGEVKQYDGLVVVDGKGVVQTSGTWAIEKGGEAFVKINDQTKKICNIESLGQEGTAKMTYKASYDDAEGKSHEVKRTFSVDVVKKLKLNVQLRFPEDNPGRTLLGAGGFFDTDLTARNIARNNYASQFQGKINQLWKPASIEFRVLADNTAVDDPPFTIGGFTAGQFIAVVNGKTQPAFSALRAANKANAINIYLVHEVRDTVKGQAQPADSGSQTLFPAKDNSDTGATVMQDASDTADGGGLAHEIGHALNLLDIANKGDIKGELNDFLKFTSEPTNPEIALTPTTKYLMLSMGRTSNFLTYPQVLAARAQAKASPARQP